MENNEDNKNKTWELIKSLFIYVIVPYITVFWVWYKKKWSMRSRVVFTVWALIILIIGIGSTNSQPTTSTPTPAPATTTSQTTTPATSTTTPTVNPEEEAKAKAEAETKAKEDAEAKQKHIQELVSSFEKSFYALDEQSKPAMDKFQTALKSNNINTAYSAAKDAKDVMKDLQVKAFGLEVSKELPDDVQKLLKDAKQDLSTAYYSKGQGFDYAMQYFDDQKPSLLQKYKDEFAMSDNFILSSAAKLVEAKGKVGLK